MDNLVVDFLNRNTWLPWVILVLFLVVIVVGLARNREIDLKFVRIGPKPPARPAALTVAQASTPPPAAQHYKGQTMNVTFEQPTSSEHYDEIAKRLAQRVETIRAEPTMRTLSPLYQPPPVSEDILFLFATRLDIDRTIVRVGSTYADGWPGISMVGAHHFLDQLVKNNVVSQELQDELYYFNELVRPVMAGRNATHSELDNIKFMAAHIVMEFNRIPSGPNSQFGLT